MILCCSLSHFGLKCDRLLFFCLQTVTFFVYNLFHFSDVYVDVLFLFGEYGLFQAFPSGQAIRSHRFAVPLLSLTLILRRL